MKIIPLLSQWVMMVFSDFLATSLLMMILSGLPCYPCGNENNSLAISVVIRIISDPLAISVVMMVFSGLPCYFSGNEDNFLAISVLMRIISNLHCYLAKKIFSISLAIIVVKKIISEFLISLATTVVKKINF